MERYTLIQPFINEEGKLTAYPAKRKKKILALFYLAENLPSDLCCSEKEINALLNTLHTFSDPATLRRELYDYGFLDRAADGSNYRKGTNPPSFEDFGLT